MVRFEEVAEVLSSAEVPLEVKLNALGEIYGIMLGGFQSQRLIAQSPVIEPLVQVTVKEYSSPRLQEVAFALLASLCFNGRLRRCPEAADAICSVRIFLADGQKGCFADSVVASMVPETLPSLQIQVLRCTINVINRMPDTQPDQFYLPHFVARIIDVMSPHSAFTDQIKGRCATVLSSLASNPTRRHLLLTDHCVSTLLTVAQEQSVSARYWDAELTLLKIVPSDHPEFSRMENNLESVSLLVRNFQCAVTGEQVKHANSIPNVPTYAPALEKLCLLPKCRKIMVEEGVIEVVDQALNSSSVEVPSTPNAETALLRLLWLCCSQ